MQDLQDAVVMFGGTFVAVVALIALRLILGRRELARMTSFDLVLLAAFGVVLGAVLVFKTPGMGEGVLALAVLALALQLNAQRPFPWPRPEGRAEQEPVLLFYNGRCLASGLARAQTTEEAIGILAQKSGYEELEDVYAVILETDGAMTVIGSRGTAVLAPPRVAHLIARKRTGDGA